MKTFHRHNHFVPQMYLKRWSVDGHKIFGYRTLVSHQNIPLWNTYSIKGVAFQPHLYTRLSAEGETDEVERWLERDFETPAEEAIKKVVSDQKLSYEDWQRLARFAAAQSVRTPAKLFQGMERWHKEMPKIMESTLKKAVTKLEEAKKTGIPIKTRKNVASETFPMRVSTEPIPDTDKSFLKVETIIGRGTWLFGLNRLLTKTLKVLLKHRWSIMFAAPNFEWFTSDDPVICLNYYGNGSYDFRGGWGNKGSEILLPLSPRHMLYTKVGAKNKSRIEVSYEFCTKLQRFIAEHSDRWIFAHEPFEKIEMLCPRIVDPTAYNTEMEAWNKWHDDQSRAEKQYMKSSEIKRSDGT